MSATEVHEIEDSRDSDEGLGLSMAPDSVEVRRNAGLAAAVGAVASTVAILYLRRAIISGSPVDWALAAVIGLLGIGWLATLVDARTPLLVADAQGVRVRLGRSWRGLPWGAVARIEHTPRTSVLRDGRLVVVPHNPERLVDELDAGASRRAALSSWLYGAPLALPLGLATRVVGTTDLSAALAALAERTTELVVIDDRADRADGAEHDRLPGGPADEEPAPETEPEPEPAAPSRVRDPRPLLASGIARVSALLPRRGVLEDEDATDEDVIDAPVEDELDDAAYELPLATPTPTPTRQPVVGARSDVRRADELAEPGVRVPVEMVEDEQVWSDRVRPIARGGSAVAPLVIDELEIEPADDPVVGPEIRAARTRLGLTVDQLADRTRIRPHVIESIEVDDFVPCGGDFYARGHLRTLCRVLGIDVAPLLEAYADRYAHAPIDPRRVFEAELATGSHGSIRGTRGGPNWSILVAVVMALVLAWSVARLVMDAPIELRGTEPILNGSGGPHGGSAAAAEPVAVVISTVGGGARIVVRDSTGNLVFKGNLAIGDTKTVQASPPLRVQTSDGAVTVSVAGRDRGPIGEPGQAAQGTYAGD